MAAVCCFEKDVAGQIQDVWVDGREHQWRRPPQSVFAGAYGLWRDILILTGEHIEPGDLASVNDVRLQGVGRDITVFFGADRVPFPERDFAIVAPAAGSDRAAFLLPTVDPIWKLVVGDDMVELGRWLVIPGTPALSSVHGYDGALIGNQQDDVRVVRVNPKSMVVVAARRAPEAVEGCAAISGFVRRSIRDK